MSREKDAVDCPKCGCPLRLLLDTDEDEHRSRIAEIIDDERARVARQKLVPTPENTPSDGEWIHAEGMNEPVWVSKAAAERIRREGGE